ncbi:Exosc3 [Symbiodinium sp. CCMP2456]|nr:Exosc3 [Symbiodinium sp. CCMP2456]
MALCLPGDEVPLQPGSLPGPGVALDTDSGRAFATTAGVLRTLGDEVRVENLRKRYIPRKGDYIVGIIMSRSADFYKVEIRAPSPAFLPTLAWNGATKRNRPLLEIGMLVYARVEAAHPDLDTELSCVDPDTKKSWNTGEVLLGELKGGLSFEVTLTAAQRLLAIDCFILDRLGKDFSYELCVGQNGRVWLVAATARETVLLLQAIKRSFGMTNVQIEVYLLSRLQNCGAAVIGTVSPSWQTFSFYGWRGSRWNDAMPKKKKSTGTSAAEGYAEDPGDARLSAVVSADAWTKVQPWFQRKGGVADTSKIALREADGDRNVVAVAGLSKGEAIFRVPAQIWFTAEGLSSHEAGRAALKWAERASEEVGLSAEHVELCLLAVLILLEGAKTAFWSDYVAALPWSTTSLPLSWTPERLSTLNGAAPQWQIQEKKSQLARAYSSVVNALQASARNAFQSACPSSDAFIKAFSLAQSRAMGIRSVGEQGRCWNLAMLPFVDMLNHSRQPEVDWDVVRTKDAGLCVVGRTKCDVKAGTELRIRYQFASAQAFFATYGFVEDVEEVRPTELRLAIDGAGVPAVLNVTSAQSLRKLLSRCRVQVATAEELKGARDLEDAARFPLSQRCEMAAFRRLQDLVQQRVQDLEMRSDGVDVTVRRLRDADGRGWRRVDYFVQSVLASLQEPGSELSATRLAVLVHSRMPICTGDVQRQWQSATFVSQKMSIRDEGGEKGRGYFANRSISAGELLLSEEPHVFNPDDDDFGAVAAVHALAAEEEGSELRVPAAEIDSISEAEAFRWLSGIPSLTKAANLLHRCCILIRLAFGHSLE